MVGSCHVTLYQSAGVSGDHLNCRTSDNALTAHIKDDNVVANWKQKGYKMSQEAERTFGKSSAKSSVFALILENQTVAWKSMPSFEH